MGNRTFHIGRRVRDFVTLSATIAAAQLVLFPSAPAVAQRALGIDVSAWQGNLSQANWNTLRNTNNRQFVFIRSSRGGTTGFYNQSDPNNNNGQNTFSQRYDDPYFVQNITRATSAGMFAGPYHFGRADILTYQGPDPETGQQGNITHTGRDEANHMLQMAGAWMRPGYLLPVYDLESGNTQRSRSSLSAFAVAFSNRIHEVMGIRPMVYLSSSYANDEVDSSVAAAMPNLWIARWPNQTNPEAIDVHNINPPAASSYPNAYGVWNPSYPNTPTPHPWKFWQYASTARLSGYANGTANIDVDVANGGIEFVKDYLVPALWMNDISGEWTSLTNWNSGQSPVAPVQGPGQVPRVGSLTLPSTRLPDVNDTVILERPNANITATLSSGTHNIRKLYVRERLDITGGSLNVNYVPSADSTPISAQFSAPVSLSDAGSLNVHTLEITAASALTLGGGTLEFNTINLMPHGVTPARLVVNGDAHIASLSGTTATVTSVAGPGIPGVVDLANDVQTIHVADGAAAVDVSINVPVVNGALTKSGPGTLLLNGAGGYAGSTTVQAGTLGISNPNLADTADVLLSTGATLDLRFTGMPDAIDSLFIDGVMQVAGTWGAPGSSAEFTSPMITGSGILEVMTFVAPVPGDYNGDGAVSTDDYDVWRATFGQSVAIGAGADGNRNGEVDAGDYVAWRRQMNAFPTGFSSGGESVPEPTTTILALGMAMLATTSRSADRCRATSFKSGR
jgi:autotransporter-associated beta strand protein